MKKSELVHCPNCPDQCWYAQGHRISTYLPNENGEDEFAGYEMEYEQVQCEFCWTMPNSYFNANKEK
jgi:hypothetical protein